MARRSGSGGKLLKWLVAIVAVVLVLVIAAIVVVPMFVPVDTIRDKIVAAVKDSTGRDLQIKGGLSFSIFPTVAVTARDVTFSNAAWAGDKPMVSLAALDVRLRLLPLLSKRIEVASFVLDKPFIDLQTDKNGHGNWEFAPQAGAAGGAAKPAPSAGSSTKPAQSAGGGAGIGEIALGDVRITDGHVSYRNGITGKTETADAINLKIGLPNLDSPLAVDGSVRWHDKPVQLTLNAAKPRGLLDGSGSEVKLNLGADAIKLTFAGTLAMAGAPKGAGDVDLSIPSVRNLVAWSTGQPLTMPGDGLGPFSLKGKVTVDGGKYGLGGVQLALDQIKGTGDLSVDTGGVRPSVKGKLAVDKLDLNHYMAAADTNAKPATAATPAPSASGGAKATANASAQQGWSDEPIDASGLKAADINLGLAADAILWRKVAIGKTGVQIVLDSGRLTLDLTDLALYQGSVKGRVQVDGSGSVLSTDANLKIDKVQVGPLLQALADTDRVTGLAVADTTLNSKGKSQKDLIGALSGKGSLALQNGVVKGIDLVGMVKNAAASVVGGNGGETAFTSASGTYTIAAGILSNKDLNVAAPTLSATGAGTVDLPRRTVDYKLSTKLASTVAVPVNIKGPWDNISWGVDLAGLATQNIGNAGKLLGSGAKGATDTLGGIGKKLFGN